MHPLALLLSAFLILALAMADSSSASIVSTLTVATTTLVWVTGTDSNGVTQTTESAYTQTFTSFYTAVELPSSGAISLGTISGSVGAIRTYTMTTINEGNGLTAGTQQSCLLAGIATLIWATLGFGFL